MKKLGYKILYRRFRPRRGGGEIDLVCRHDDTLVFAEVKTRTSLDHGRPVEAVGAEKQRLIVRGAHAWLRMLPEAVNPLYRFDVVEVVVSGDGTSHCEVIENAFVPSDQIMR